MHNKNVLSLLSYTQILSTVLGIRKVNVYKNIFIEPGNWYKLYAFICYILLIACGAITTFKVYIMKPPKTFYTNISILFRVTLILNHVGFLFVYKIVALKNIFINPKKSIQFFTCMTKVDRVLDKYSLFDDKNYALIIIQVVLIVYKMFHIPMDVTTWSFDLYYIAIHAMTTIVDLEIIYYTYEINIIARRFEGINKIMIHLGKYHLNTNMGVLINIWQRSSKKIIFSASTKNCITDLIDVFNYLIESLKIQNNIYGSLVTKFLL